MEVDVAYLAVGVSLIALGAALCAFVQSRRLQTREGSVTWMRHHYETERGLTYELVREVQALREAKILELEESKDSIRHSIYAQVYERTALLMHNSAGPSTGWDKLLRKFRGKDSWSEIGVLAQLGFDANELSEYKKKADEMMYYT